MALGVLLSIGWLFGGGGVGAALPNLAVQLVACILLAVNLPAVLDFWRSAPLSLRCLTAATLALPLLYLVPVPPAVWHGLPGRDLAVGSLSLVGGADEWRAPSIDPHRTALAATGLLAPFTVVVLTWRSRTRDISPLLALIVCLGLAALVLGTLQLATANELLMIYGEARRTTDLQATFANRNSSGLFFDIALACLVALPGMGNRLLDHPFVRVAIGALLVIGVVVSHSRTGMALALVPLAAAAMLWHANRGTSRGSGRWLLALALVAAAIAAGAAAISAIGNNRLHDAAERFSRFDDPRLYIWPDGLTVTKRFWPVGGGTGTFDDAFQIDESLETLQPSRAGRAHNDYLEITYESGVIGVLLVASWLAWFIAGAVRRFRDGTLRHAIVAPIVVCLIALQSTMDYPLRNQSLLCIAALIIGLFAFEGGRAGHQVARPRSPNANGGDLLRETRIGE